MCTHIVKEAKYRKYIFNTYAVTAVILGICLLLQDNHLLYMQKYLFMIEQLYSASLIILGIILTCQFWL